MNAYRFGLCGALLACRLGAAAPAGLPDDGTLDSWLRRDSYVPPEKTKQVVACGQRAVDAILKVVSTPVYRTGITRRGITPRATAHPHSRTRERLGLLRRIDAPVPVERLSEFVEMGLGADSSWSALAEALQCLALSGHTRGRDLTRYHLRLAKQSHSNGSRLWALRLDSYLGLWDVCRECITSGETPTTEITLRTLDGKAYTRPYQPAPATLAMRRLYAADAASLDWDREIDSDYLRERLEACAPVLRDREKCILTDYGSFGRFYESLLAPVVLDWLNGKGEVLVKVFGGALPTSGRSSDPRRPKVRFLQKLCTSMTGSTAAKVKLMLEAESGTTGYGLLCCDPQDWLTEYLKQYGNDAGRAATAITALGMLERGLTDEEVGALPKMLALPRLRFSYQAEEYALKPLAKKHPEAFVAALQSAHLSKEVVSTILTEKLSEDRQLVLERIEYAMLHQYDRAALSPEDLARRLAKMPAHIRARAMRAMKRPRRRRIDTRWLPVVQKHFPGDEGIGFLQALAQKKEFATAKRQIENAIREMQKQ